MLHRWRVVGNLSGIVKVLSRKVTNFVSTPNLSTRWTRSGYPERIQNFLKTQNDYLKEKILVNKFSGVTLEKQVEF